LNGSRHINFTFRRIEQVHQPAVRAVCSELWQSEALNSALTVKVHISLSLVTRAAPHLRHARRLNNVREDLTIFEMGLLGPGSPVPLSTPHPPRAYFCLFASTEDSGTREARNITVAIKLGFTASEPHLADVCRYARINDVR
jgi:hypothetical protein